MCRHTREEKENDVLRPGQCLRQIQDLPRHRMQRPGHFPKNRSMYAPTPYPLPIPQSETQNSFESFFGLARPDADSKNQKPNAPVPGDHPRNQGLPDPEPPGTNPRVLSHLRSPDGSSLFQSRPDPTTKNKTELRHLTKHLSLNHERHTKTQQLGHAHVERMG